MDNTTKQTFLFESGRFYLQNGTDKTPVPTDDIQRAKAGYSICISDSELFYTTMEFPEAPKRKLPLFISNYLMGTFPQQLCERFCYIRKDDTILIGLFRPDIPAEAIDIISRASVVTSPLAAVYACKESFSYSIGDQIIDVSDGILSAEETTDRPLEKPGSPDFSIPLVIPFAKHMPAAYGWLKIPAAVLTAAYILFFIGEYFRMYGVQQKLADAELRLSSIYEKAGVAGSRDPYGKLLAMTGGDSTERYRTLFLLEKLTRAHNSSITATSLEIKGNNVTLQGTSTDYTYLEQFQKNLSETTGRDAQIVDTVKKDTQISFTLRFEI